MRKWIAALMLMGSTAALVTSPAAAQAGEQTADVAKQGETEMPKDLNVLFWSQDMRDQAFQAMEHLPTVPMNIIKAGGTPYPLPDGKPLDMDVDAYMASQRHAGLMILVDGKVRLEKYALGFSANKRWTSFSVAKSFTSTLVGAAVKDGYIKSLDDAVTEYIPVLKGSAYDGVSVRQVLTMSSGVRWNEDYQDPKSDVAQFNLQQPVAGEDVTVTYMKKLPRAAAPGTVWNYNTGETNLIGVLVSSATGKTLAEYLTEKVWKPYGMEMDAMWMLGASGHEVSGCCISASLRDYARLGQFTLGGGVAGGQQVVPDNWFSEAVTGYYNIGVPGRGYGYQWWTYADGSYAAQGIFGQGIFIDPKRKLVIASNGNWPKATDHEGVGEQRQQFYKQVQAALDAEAR
jgi:CubicO group peptidase (beta-lactamase class C family)